MRVIAGELKGRTLSGVPGSNTRPTSDKIKEAVFHMMGPFFQGGDVLDLFAGSGSLGIEAVSRGMDRVVFIDTSPLAIRTIRKNIHHLEITSKCDVYKNEAFRALRLLAKKEMKFDLILLDPPYEKVNYERLVQEVQSIANPFSTIYIEHPTDKKMFYNDSDFTVLHYKKYNPTTSITILQYTGMKEESC